MKIESIVVDGTQDGERYKILVNNQPIALRRKSFMYFARLARFGQHNNGWVYKEDLEEGFNQARFIHQMKKELSESLGEGTLGVESNREGYYRLNVSPEVISFNIKTLQQHEDYRVRELFEQS